MLISALLLLASNLPAGEWRTEEEAPPNVLLIVVDDLGWADLGCYGAAFYETPRIDRLAGEGTRFTQAYSNGPNCAPSRASLMTGRATPRHGISTVGPSARGRSRDRRLLVPETRRALRDQEWTLAEALAGAGYATASMGKWHLGESPLQQGFEINVAGSQRGSPRSYFSPYRNPALSDGAQGEHLTARLTAEAVEFLEAEREGPFFLYLSYFAVHTPIQGRPDLVDKYREKKANDSARLPRPAYAAMVEAVDQGVGEVLDTLERLELAESTLVVLVSDNGGHGKQTGMGGLRGSKGMLYEGGVRVPMLARWPGHVAAGVAHDTPILGSDWFPTLLDAARVPLPAELELDGRSLWPLLEGRGSFEERSLAWHFPAYLEAYGKGPSPWRTTPAGALRSGRHKLIEFFEDGRRELYDLEQDPGEQHDLASSEPELVERLAAELSAWRQRVGAVVPTESNPAFEDER